MYYKVQNASITLGGTNILEDINFYIKEKEIELLEKKIKEYNDEFFKEEIYANKEKFIIIKNKIDLLEKELKKKLNIWENNINL